MNRIRTVRSPGWRYLVIDLPFHKAIEVGFQPSFDRDRFHLSLSLSFTGRDHAGLRISAQVRHWFFELNVCDNRHWDHANGRWA